MAEPVQHTVKFERNQFTGRWRASCTCFWTDYGEREDVQKNAAVHDITWIVEDPAANRPTEDAP